MNRKQKIEWLEKEISRIKHLYDISENDLDYDLMNFCESMYERELKRLEVEDE